MPKRKIKSVHIKHFRGVPTSLSVDFTKKDGKNALSTIIYGSNGSGKSTIVDALEFCLQGKIERSEDLKNSTRPSVLNYGNLYTENPVIEVTFDDDTNWERHININKQDDGMIELLASNKTPHPDFSVAPIVLRRNDIITYNYTNGDQRLIHLLQYFYNKGNEVVADNDERIINLQQDRARYRKGFHKNISLLSEKTGLSEEELTENKNSIRDYFKRFFVPRGGNELKNNIIGKDKKKIDPKLYLELERISNDIYKYIEKLSNLKSKEKKLRGEINRETYVSLKEDLSKCETFLLPAFKSISRFKYISDIKLSISEFSITSLDIQITLDNGIVVKPHEIFSEANFDLLILILYMSMIKVASDKGQSNILILDDVLQSVDSSIREKFILYYLRSKEFKGWQFIITCHDKLWLRELEEIMQNAGITQRKVISIDRWTMSDGPVIRSLDETNIDNSIQDAKNSFNTVQIASAAGLLLEKICNQMTQYMGSSIHRSIGDIYTLKPLLDSFKASAKNIIDYPELNECLQRVYDNKHIRNMVGAHYNPYAENMDEETIYEFADDVQELYDMCFCKECYSWLKLKGKEISCDKKCNGKVYHIK